MDFGPGGLPELGLPELQLIAYGDFSHQISKIGDDGAEIFVSLLSML